MRKDFNLKIDYNKTRKSVERFMEDYNFLKFRLEEGSIPCITGKWTLEIPMRTIK